MYILHLSVWNQFCRKTGLLVLLLKCTKFTTTGAFFVVVVGVFIYYNNTSFIVSVFSSCCLKINGLCSLGSVNGQLASSLGGL